MSRVVIENGSSVSTVITESLLSVCKVICGKTPPAVMVPKSCICPGK